MKRSRRLDFSLALSGTLVGPLIISMSLHTVEKISAAEPVGKFWLENFSQFLLWTLKSPRKDISEKGNSFGILLWHSSRYSKNCWYLRFLGANIYYAEKLNRVAYRDFDP